MKQVFWPAQARNADRKIGDRERALTPREWRKQMLLDDRNAVPRGW